MKQIISFTVALLFLTITINSQVISPESKKISSVDYNRLGVIDNIINEYVQKHYLVGVTTLVIKDNTIVQYKGYGYADAESRKPMERDAIFRIMSQTKAITSVGIMILYEKGKLNLDEPIADFIPEFRHPAVLDKYNAVDTTFTSVPAKREITFRDLLTHTSGIDYADIGSDKGKAIYAKANIPSGLGEFNASLLEKMKVLGKQPLLFQPGEKWQYGLNSDLLGCLIEVISGLSLEDFLRQNIFIPLGMNDTYFNLPASKAGRLAGVYTEDSTGHIIKWSHTFRNIDPDYPLKNKHYFSGGAGLSSTVYDYGIFLQMLLNGGIYNGHRILSPRSVELMTSPQMDFPYSGSDYFGLGFGLTSAKSANRNVRNEGSYGWGGYYGTSYWVDPKAHLVCLIYTQQNPNSHYDFGTKFESAVYNSLIK
ncbi:MAG TPA: serine hydrolase domain-containing protein [Flavisolibacter sp.]|nr:serine hydrolase domain-containing protein [Flavisolibacter sp.]